MAKLSILKTFECNHRLWKTCTCYLKSFGRMILIIHNWTVMSGHTKSWETFIYMRQKLKHDSYKHRLVKHKQSHHVFCADVWSPDVPADSSRGQHTLSVNWTQSVILAVWGPGSSATGSKHVGYVEDIKLKPGFSHTHTLSFPGSTQIWR